MTGAYERREETAFHEWRKRVKDLGYQIQILRDLWPPVLEELRKDLKKLGDLLGEEHDFDRDARQRIGKGRRWHQKGGLKRLPCPGGTASI